LQFVFCLRVSRQHSQLHTRTLINITLIVHVTEAHVCLSICVEEELIYYGMVVVGSLEYPTCPDCQNQT
jgi:hypothetical protein